MILSGKYTQSMDREDQLVFQLSRGSKTAFTQVYELYFDLLYGFVFNLVHSHDAATEVVQDTFVKVWINHRQINPSLSFKSFLFTIAKNQLINRMKQQFRHPLFDDYLSYCDDSSLSILPENSYDFNRFLQSLAEAKAELTPRQREAFELYMEEGNGSAEAARQMGISEQAFFNHLSKALGALRLRLKQYAPVLLFLVVKC